MKLAVIPARGGSTRIPRKNIKEFLGKPIIAYSIETALNSNLFDKVIVSTDDEEIAVIARQHGAKTPFIRPQELGRDEVGTNDIVKHAIQWYQSTGKHIEFACCIYATAPLLQAKYLAQGLDIMIETGGKFCFSTTSFPFPIQRALKLAKDGGIEMFWPEHYLSRSQNLEEAYHDAGQFYWGTAAAYLNDVMMFSNHSIPVLILRYLVQDIDTMEDWTRAEHMYRAVNETSG